ncbi:MAG: NADH-quinone oxidoreductase subunit L [Chloroflexi bacterium]|nr:NADH-quinone oxidoreductase subunit L [Chloroflexota bacterium]
MELAFLAPAIPAVAFIAILLFGRWLPGKGSYLSIGAITASVVIFFILLIDLVDNGGGVSTIDWFEVGSSQFTLGTSVSPISVAMIGIVSFVSLMIQIYSLKYMEGDPRIGWYFAVHSLFAAAMMALVLADNLLFLYIAWEGVGLGSYLLIGFWWERRSATEAAKKAFITTRIGDVGLLIGIILLFRETGTFEIAAIFEAAEAGEIGQNILNWSMFLIFLGAAGKSAQVPFHVWLPDAMEGPTPVSALIHAATMVAAGVFLIAVLFPLYQLTPFVLDLIAAIGVTTALGGAMIAVVMTDMKRILAYSTISHLGFMMLALGAGEVGVAMFHLFAHAFAKAVLFLAAGSVNHGTGQTDVRKMGGLWRKMPITTITFTISALSLAGLPPLGGFFSKDEILLAVWDGRISGAYLIVALIAVVFSAIYTSRIIYKVFFGPASDESAGAHESPIAMIGPMILLTAFGAVGGAIAFEWGGFGGIIGWVANEAEAHGIEFTIWLTVLSAALAIGSMAIVFRMLQAGDSTIPSIRRRLSVAQRLLENRFYFDELYQWFIDRVVMTTSGVVGWFDRRAINDEGVDRLPNATGWWGREMRYLQTGKVYNYAAGMAAGAAIGVIIWWVQ